MRALSILAFLLVIPVAAPNAADRTTVDETLSHDARAELREAIEEFHRGDRQEARDTVRSLLLEGGATVAFEDEDRSEAPVEAAVETWRKALTESPLAVAKPDEEPEISVKLVHKVEDDDELQGVVEFDRDGGKISATIQVRDNVDDRPIKENEMAAVITHELGHVLGLEDAPGTDGIMSEFDPEDLITAPNAHEVETVKQLRTDLRAALAQMR